MMAAKFSPGRMADSVSSRMSREGARPVAARASLTTDRIPADRNWVGETLTDTATCCGKATACSQARQIAQLPLRHQPRFLGDADELGRRHEAAARMVPAHQRLEADDLA